MWGWVSRLRKYFDNQKGKDVDIYNGGISGDRTKDLLERLEAEAEIRKSKLRSNIFIFQIGINDTQDNQISLKQFANNLHALYISAQKFATTVLFLWLTNIDETKTTPTIFNPDVFYYKKDVIVYNELILNFCLENNISFVDVLSLLSYDDLEDGIHPNAQWHEKIYVKVRDFMLENKLI